MKRRDFIKKTTAAGVTGVFSHGCSSMLGRTRKSGSGFNVHPFVLQNPEAVFIHLTDVDSKHDTDAMRDVGHRLAQELIIPVQSGGHPNSTKINVKPNWTSAGPQDGKPVFEKLGINTDPNFIEGWVQGMRKAGPQKYYIRECCCPGQWEPMGWKAMAERNDIDLRPLSRDYYWDLKKRDLNFVEIPNGVVFKQVGYMSPFNEHGTFLVNLAKMKSHGMGITAAIKNLQGICGRYFHNFCTPYDQVRSRFHERYREFLQDDFEKNIETLHARHMKEGIPRWDRPTSSEKNIFGGGIWMEVWVQRMLDSYSVTPTGLNVVEGIYSQDGNGFGRGPYEKLGSYGVTSRDYMSNVVIFGIDPFRVDIITHWLAGHEPGNFGLFHIGIERGLSDVLAPQDIPVYLWKDGQATLTKIENLKRTPLVTYYLQRDYNGQKEPYFHLCDEPFDYSGWKTGKRLADCTPSIEKLGRDRDNRMVMGLTLPQRDNVMVDVLNKKGEVVWRLVADDLEPGVHQVIWDGFQEHGLYSFYVKGMGWDAEKQVVTLS